MEGGSPVDVTLNSALFGASVDGALDASDGGVPTTHHRFSDETNGVREVEYTMRCTPRRVRIVLRLFVDPGYSAREIRLFTIVLDGTRD